MDETQQSNLFHIVEDKNESDANRKEQTKKGIEDLYAGFLTEI